MSKFQYRNNWYALAPPWLRTGNAELYMGVMQLCSDLLIDKMNQAIQFRMPGHGDPSQLPYLANDRLLVQGPAESNDSFVARLTGAIPMWKKAGSRVASLENIQAYMQGLQPGIAASLPAMTIVGGSYPTVAKWDTLYQGDAVGAKPSRFLAQPSNFDWDGQSIPYRAWLILYMSLVPTGLSGTNPNPSAVSPGSLLGQNVNGVWVPGTSGTAVNSPWLTYTGLSGLSSANVGQWLTIGGGGPVANRGTWPIVSVLSSTSCVVAQPNALVAGATGTWSIGYYPFIGPGPSWGSPGYVFGQGQSSTPPVDTGKSIGGVWSPSGSSTGYGPSLSWGLTCSAETIVSIRQLLKRFKSSGTYYPHIVVVFDNGNGSAGSEYSPNSIPGAGNPDGSFGPVGANVSGVWTPTRLLTSPYDCYCQGTGERNECSVENIT